MKLTGGGEWKKARCPFHKDKKSSLFLRLDTGGFRCVTCRVHGGDVLAFHRKLYGLGFVEAAKELGAWGWNHD
jgi:DNA primase